MSPTTATAPFAHLHMYVTEPLLIIKRDRPFPSFSRIPDKWHSCEWVETTRASCNVWGRGQNQAFGKFFTIGVHDPGQRRIAIYKVRYGTVRYARKCTYVGVATTEEKFGFKKRGLVFA